MLNTILSLVGLGNKVGAGGRDPFDLQGADGVAGGSSANYYDLGSLAGASYSLPTALQSYSPKELARLRDSRELQLSPAVIIDEVALGYDGRFSAVIEAYATDFGLTTEEDQDRAVGGLHNVLLQFNPDFDYQIKNRVVEADLQPVVDLVEYTQRTNETTQRWNQTARDYKAFLHNLSGRFSMMERHNYVVVSYRSTKLAAMEQAFQKRTGRHSRVFDPLGLEESAVQATTTVVTSNKGKSKKGKSKGKDLATLNLIAERQEQQARLRVEREMEEKIFDEKARVIRLLESEITSLCNSLSSNGLFVERLGDWQLMAFYADYLKPELAEQARIGMQEQSIEAAAEELIRDLYSRNSNSDASSNNYKPLALSDFLGNQSVAVVNSGVPIVRKLTAAALTSGGNDKFILPAVAAGMDAPALLKSQLSNEAIPETNEVNTKPSALPPLSVRVLRSYRRGGAALAMANETSPNPLSETLTETSLPHQAALGQTEQYEKVVTITAQELENEQPEQQQPQQILAANTNFLSVISDNDDDSEI